MPASPRTFYYTIPNVVAAQDDRIADALAVIDNQLASSTYLLGDNLSACDFFLFMLAEWSLPIKKSPLHFPHLATYLKRMSQHPTIQAVSEIENIDLSPFH
ncbi:hypothetical protein C9J03_03490 [Photobacterium gaetbulicola]|nr:hypothetical protein C9J03_03490 [Photobacterium gaetbulicola]